MNHKEKNHPAAILVPSLLFSLVAMGAFCTWAFGANIFESEITLYTACAVVFLGLGGLALHPYSGIQSRGEMAFTFAMGFVFYAVIWSLAWFSFRNTFGEILGSLAGLTAMMLVMKKQLQFSAPLIVLIAIAFLWHTLGYYAGGYAYKMIPASGLFTHGSTVAKLAWGACYGLGMGLGISQAIQLSRKV